MSRQPYDKLKFRIHNIPKSVDLFEEFPELKQHPELKHPTQPNEVFRYLCYMYDPGSDLVREEADVTDRHKKAKILSGIFENTDDDVLTEMGFYFLSRLIHKRKFREWYTLQRELEENNRARWTEIDPNEKDQKKLMEAYGKKGLLREQAMEIQKALDAIESEIFGDNDNVKEKAIEKLLTTPEKVASAYSVG